MSSFEVGVTFPQDYEILDSRPTRNHETAYQEDTLASLNELLINSSPLLDSELVASTSSHFMAPVYRDVSVTNGGFHMDILSASKYPDLLAQDADLASSNRRKIHQILYGGLSMVEDNENGDAAMAHDNPNPEKPAPRKRSKKNSNKSNNKSSDDENGKKQRGRPRLDTRDETAADVCACLRNSGKFADFYSDDARK